MLAPVAIPSSTRITVFPRRSTRGALGSIHLRSLVQAWLGNFNNPRDLWRSDVSASNDVLVKKAFAAFGHRTEGQLLLAGNRKFSREENIELRP